jgi:hypothetical protein
MSRPAPLFDRAVATAVFGVPSAYCAAYPDSRLAKRIGGDNPIRWRALRTHADEVPEWLKFDPDETAGMFRSTYIRGGVVAAPHLEVGRAVSALERDFGGHAVPAAAFRVGKALVAAEIPDYQGNQLQHTEDIRGHRAAILGIGTGVLWATVGAMHVEAGEFVGANMLMASEPDYLQALVVTYPTTPKL